MRRCTEIEDLSDSEITFIEELVEQGVAFLVIGMGAASLHGADVVTQDIDLWFSSLSHPGIEAAARKAGGVFAWRADPPAISGFLAQPTSDRMASSGLEHIDLVTRPQGLRVFDIEYAQATTLDLFGVPVRVLPLDRVIASKTAADRPKDRTVLPALRAALAAMEDD